LLGGAPVSPCAAGRAAGQVPDWRPPLRQFALSLGHPRRFAPLPRRSRPETSAGEGTPAGQVKGTSGSTQTVIPFATSSFLLRGTHRQLEQDLETVINVLRPGPLGIIEHKFSATEVHEAKAIVERAVANWRRNTALEKCRHNVEL
ncbi:hypothetical protein Taro_005206, partial [Colocasia esculenta]|nr:hypothetical protein [Colocasia esculenta]